MSVTLPDNSGQLRPVVKVILCSPREGTRLPQLTSNNPCMPQAHLTPAPITDRQVLTLPKVSRQPSCSVRWRSASRCARRCPRTYRVAFACSAFDLVAVSNICLDVVLPVEQLPPLERIDRVKLLEEKTASIGQACDQTGWELGGSCNVAVAAARLGLSVATCGNISADVYGQFLQDNLQV